MQTHGSSGGLQAPTTAMSSGGLQAPTTHGIQGEMQRNPKLFPSFICWRRWQQLLT